MNRTEKKARANKVPDLLVDLVNEAQRRFEDIVRDDRKHVVKHSSSVFHHEKGEKWSQQHDGEKLLQKMRKL